MIRWFAYAAIVIGIMAIVTGLFFPHRVIRDHYYMPGTPEKPCITISGASLTPGVYCWTPLSLKR